jgi:predicted ferric reductase
MVLYRNHVLRRRFPRAFITKIGRGYKVTLAVQGKLKVEAGQYINLWMPSISFWSFLQSHPFTIASCETGEQTILELLIKPQKGLTSMLQRLADDGAGDGSEIVRTSLGLSLFTGPHGVSAHLDRYERVLMFASGLGIAVQLPYLRQLIRGFNDFTASTRRIHLVWQLENIGKCTGYKTLLRQLTVAEDGAPAEEFLNKALGEDALDDGYVCIRLLAPMFLLLIYSRYYIYLSTTHQGMLNTAR